MGLTLSQMFPPKATFTESNIPDLTGKVFIVTGGYSGVGYHVSSVLYHAGGKVYMAGRSQSKADEAIRKIPSQSSSASASPTKETEPTQTGSLHFLPLDLSDLTTIKPAVRQFQSAESSLHVLFNNAGVSLPPKGSRSAQSHELQMATNCLGPFLLSNLLLPQLASAASSQPRPQKSSVRVVWTSSQVVELASPTGGMSLTDLQPESIPTDQNQNYTNSKTGNYFLASELSKRWAAEHDVLSLTTNPGAVKTKLLRHTSALFRLCVAPLMHPAIKGAYTELYAGLAAELAVEEHGGGYIIPWGRLHPGMREDLKLALLREGEGGTGVASRFWEWCEEQTREFM